MKYYIKLASVFTCLTLSLSCTPTDINKSASTEQNASTVNQTETIVLKGIVKVPQGFNLKQEKAGSNFEVKAFNDNDNQVLGISQTDSSGNYSISGVPTGQRVRVEASHNANKNVKLKALIDIPQGVKEQTQSIDSRSTSIAAIIEDAKKRNSLVSQLSLDNLNTDSDLKSTVDALDSQIQTTLTGDLSSPLQTGIQAAISKAHDDIEALRFSSSTPQPPEDPPSPSPSISKASTLPNILFILSDDLGIDLLNSYNFATSATGQPQTPSIDMMAAEGVLFKNAWSNPTCSPTRGTVQLGQYGFQTGLGWAIQNNPDFTYNWSKPETLANLLKSSQSYKTGIFGKWHLGGQKLGSHPDGYDNANVAGYDIFEGLMVASSDYMKWTEIVSQKGTPATTVKHDGRYLPEEQIDSALQWIKTRNSNGEHWFTYLPVLAPYEVHHRPPSTLVPEDSGVSLPTSDKECENNKSNFRECYRGALVAMDTLLGRLINELKKDPSWNNTYIIFVGDNGPPKDVIAPPFIDNKVKGSLYNGGIHVPFIISGGAMNDVKGQQSEALVNTVDLYSTILKLASIPVPSPQNTISQDLSPVLKKPATSGNRDWIYAERFFSNGTTFPPPEPEAGSTNRMWDVAIRNNKFKLIRNCLTDTPGKYKEELYNVQFGEDFMENNNLMGKVENVDSDPIFKTNYDKLVNHLKNDVGIPSACQ